jgi:phage terminase Nu1 subunit (DNA packaging protein)
MTDVTIRELAAWTGIGAVVIRGRLNNLPAKPGPRNASLYDSRDALRLIYITEASADDLDLSQERARLAKAQADITEMQREELRAELVRGGEVEAYWSQIIINAKLQLAGLARRIGHLVLGVPTLGEVESVIAAEVEATLNELADFVPLPSPADSAVVAPAATADDEPVGGPVQAPVERDKRRTRKVADKPRAVPKGHAGRRGRPQR